jgi:hypothetical protein
MAYVDLPVDGLRILRHFVFRASRHGRCVEVAWWSNAAAAVGLGAGAFFLGGGWPVALVVAIAAFALLRLALAHPVTLCLAACAGTLSVAALGGGAAWLFGHLLESWPAAPWVALVVGALGSGAVPAWAYHRLAVLRATGVPDSLVYPASVPSSR